MIKRFWNSFLSTAIIYIVKGDFNQQCPVPDLAELCESDCTGHIVNCIEVCGDDQGCISNCKRTGFDCFDACPCHANCFEGCEGCSNSVCGHACDDPSENQDRQKCIDFAIDEKYTCDKNCDYDKSCFDDCAEKFELQFNNCPCEDGCRFGCPCPNYTCDETAPEYDTVLILNQWQTPNVPLLYHVGGELEKKRKFQYGAGSGSYKSCSAVLKGRMFVIGGWYTRDSTDQISEVGECTLSRIGTLPSSTDQPACNTFEMTTPKVWICFHGDYQGLDGLLPTRLCRSFDGETIVEEPTAIHNHVDTSLGVFDGSPFALGSDYPNGNKEVEHFKEKSNTWVYVGQFPFVSNRIAEYSTVTLNNILYIFGGYDKGTSLDLAAKYDGSTWERVGTLLHTRHGHRSIVQGSKVLHICGYDDMDFEEWTFGEGEIQKKAYDSKIANYGFYPESFWVPSDFCK